jgi:hypothetical protein
MSFPASSHPASPPRPRTPGATGETLRRDTILDLRTPEPTQDPPLDPLEPHWLPSIEAATD